MKYTVPVAPLVSSMVILYIGGINSTGMRAAGFRADGYKVIAPTMHSENKTAFLAWALPWFNTNRYREELIAQVLDQTTVKPDLVIGSSQGGAIAMALQSYFSARLLLLAPAWRCYGVKPIVPANTVVIHGNADWIVSVEDSRRLAIENGCRLVEVDDSHHLPESGVVIEQEIKRISVLQGMHKPEAQIKREQAEYRACTKKAIEQLFFLETESDVLLQHQRTELEP